MSNMNPQSERNLLLTSAFDVVQAGFNIAQRKRIGLEENFTEDEDLRKAIKLSLESTDKEESQMANALFESSRQYVIHNVLPKREVDFDDPLEVKFMYAERLFLKNWQGDGIRPSIESIDIIFNKDIEARFEAHKIDLGCMGSPTREIMAFHGTDETNLDSIFTTNFSLDKCCRFVYGKGIYLSENPGVALDFGKALIVCRVLIGREAVSNSPGIPDGYDSLSVKRMNYLLVKSTNQILPQYRINLVKEKKKKTKKTKMNLNV